MPYSRACASDPAAHRNEDLDCCWCDRYAPRLRWTQWPGADPIAGTAILRTLTRYTDDGRLEIDNSTAERALRAVALGRKGFLFAGSDYGGERAAAMYSLIGSAKLNGLDPELYLRTVLARIADHPVSHIQDLLLWNLAHALQSHASQAA